MRLHRGMLINSGYDLTKIQDSDIIIINETNNSHFPNPVVEGLGFVCLRTFVYISSHLEIEN